MRLKQLEIVGLKSFANKTSLHFHRGVTAIVGPNGCGKSNVVDAVRWVLGEQSAKHLRGDSMEDVIFKGNGRLAPAGMAEVSLTFANDEPVEHVREEDAELEVSTFVEELRKMSEITVSRRYFRSGESEYYINRTPCRLKDITELFLGTGIGSKAYAIIEQGRVEQLINAKPEDRRLFLEEAGGTTLYRSRRLAAERKIERTRENLSRVTDVHREIERQVQYLHRLAKRAEKYRALKEESRDLELRLGSHRWRRATDELTALTATIEESHLAEAQLREERDRIDAALAERTAALQEAEEKYSQIREVAAVLGAERDAEAARIDLLAREIDERRRRLSRLEAEQQTQTARRGDLDAELAALEERRDALAVALQADRTEVQGFDERLAAGRASVADARRRADEARSTLAAASAEDTALRNELQRRQRGLQEARGRMARARRQSYELGEQAVALAHAQRAARLGLEKLEAELATVQSERQRLAEQVASLRKDLAERESALAKSRNAAVRLGSSLEALRAVRRSYEGYDAAVRSVLLDADRPEGVVGVVGDVLSVTAEWETALSAVLGARIGHIIVDAPEVGANQVRRLRERNGGRGSFVPLEPTQHDAPEAPLAEIGQPILQAVRVEDRYRPVVQSIVGDAFVVPDLETAVRLWREQSPRARLVTPAGDILEPDGTISGGSERRDEAELISRQRRLLELEQTLERDQAAIDIAAAEVEQVRAELSGLSARLDGLAQSENRLANEVRRLRRDVERTASEFPRARDRARSAATELTSAASEQSEHAGAIVHLESRLSDTERARREAEVGLNEATAAASAAERAVEELVAVVRQSSVRAAEREQQLDAATQGIARIQNESTRLRDRLAALETELKTAAAELASMTQARGAAEESVADKRSAAERQAQEVRQAREGVEALRQASSELETRGRQLRGQFDAVVSRLTQAEVAAAERRSERDHLAADVQERHGVDLAEIEAPEVEIAPEEEGEMQRRVTSLREQMARLGEVDLGSIAELEQLEERARFLVAQKEDLERSLTDLERTIQKLNRVSRERFATTFAAANEKFQEILPRLLRGGEARLVLTDEDNLLESGVEIYVRPPGKRLDTVTLLSGGEKALVAVSLIFSLFLINPTPFCFLDEVDAPLDDANIGRFAGLVREMSAHSQFVVITHNKRTMEAADILYGVTMQEPGVSKVVSVAAS